MTITTTFPGVYLSETPSLNFSISSSGTVIPAFVTNGTQKGIPTDKITYYTSWADVEAVIPKEHNDQYYYIALRYWFSQVGGPCYLIDYDELRLLHVPDDVTVIVGNGNTSHTITYFAKSISGSQKRFVILDGPKDKITSSDDVTTLMKTYPVSPYGAVFYPWGLADWASTAIPPSVLAVVAFAQTDRSRGVWKAPANVVLNGITPQYPVSDDLQGRFNQGKALNMIRTFPNVGTVVWGARTLDDSDNWRYIPVRRLFNMVEKDIQKALNKLVFEPNSQPTWQKVKAAVDNYLHSLWKKGALAGNKQEEAWFVEIGKDITMTEDDINQGKMIIKIGLAAVRPAEFVIIQFSQDLAQ